MEHFKRFLAVCTVFILSMIAMHKVRALRNLPYQGYRVACIPLENAKKQNADTQLLPYAQIAHNSMRQDGDNITYRCYFRFAPKDLICTPKHLAKEQNLQGCPKMCTIDGSSKKLCYLLNQQFAPLINQLKKDPTVPMESYMPNQSNVVERWQQIRDILLGKK